jgi:hypothetical protein
MVARLVEANGSMCFLVQRMVVDENKAAKLKKSNLRRGVLLGFLVLSFCLCSLLFLIVLVVMA